MRVETVRISGFRSIPVCATHQLLPRRAARSTQTAAIEWQQDAFVFRLPCDSESEPLLAAVIGANSAGKSSILQALYYAFGPVIKLPPSLFHGAQTDRPVIVEITLRGSVSRPGKWHAINCMSHGDTYVLTVAHVWQAENRIRYIRRPDGIYYKQTQQDRAQCERLMPEFRAIWSGTTLQEEAELDRNNLLGDLIDALLAREEEKDSVLYRMREAVHDLECLLERRQPAAGVTWRAVEELESQLSAGLAAMTPQHNRVRLCLKQNVPSVRSLFGNGVLAIDDGVELGFEQHGLGLQRSFVVSTLSTWCRYMRDSTRDYLFAIEEPEIYLHPHASRVLLNTLEAIADQDQVIFTTHASEFVNRVALPNILTVQRRIRRGKAESQVRCPDLQALACAEVVKVQRYLREDRSDMLFARSVLLVEGQAEFFALPGFARTLGLDLDAQGISIVFVNGMGNFSTYHQILAAFAIPHVILMDGDGQRAKRQKRYAHFADALCVLEKDFETAVAGALSGERLLALINACLVRQGKPLRESVAQSKDSAKALAALGKPLVGRAAGEMLSVEELERMPQVVTALKQTVALAHRDTDDAGGTAG